MRIKSIIIGLFFSIVLQNAFSQIKLLPVTAANDQNGEGVFYFLPKTVFKIDFDLYETKKIPGPLKEYSKHYIGVSDVIEDETSEFKVVDIEVTPVMLADKSSSYFISFKIPEKSKEKEPKEYSIGLTPDGLLSSFNLDISASKEQKKQQKLSSQKIFVIGEEASNFQYEADYNKKLNIDTVIRKISIDTMTINKFVYRTSWVDKSLEQRADDAAKQIKKIRDSRFNLLTGYHEVNFSGSIKYMDSQLKKLEKQYLELFIGKEIMSVKHYTVFFTPNESELQKELFKSDEGDRLTIKVAKINEPLIKEVEAPLDNALIYRVPADCEVRVLYNMDNVFDKIFPVNQLGIKTSVNINKISVAFNVKTGLPVAVNKN